MICQVSSREMEIQREQWQSYISVVLNKWVKARSKNADSPSISSNVSLFSAVIFVYIAQTRCGLKEELKETEALVAGFVQSYEEQISTRAQDYEETERKPSKAKGKGRKGSLTQQMPRQKPCCHRLVSISRWSAMLTYWGRSSPHKSALHCTRLY